MARKLRTILCPLDFSTPSLEALDYAADIARQNDGQLILLHVVENPWVDLYGPKWQGFFAELEHALKWSKTKLDNTAQTRAADLTCETIAKRGNPYEEIIDVAKAREVDVIVMSTHGRTGLQRLSLGSVTEKVLRTSPCPVLAVREAKEG